ALAEERRASIGGALDPGPGGAGGRRDGVLTRTLQGRPNHPAADGWDPRETAHAGALEQPHDQRLGLVVGRVAERDPRRTDANGSRLQGVMARGPGGGFDRARVNTDAHDVDGHTEVDAERPDEFTVPRRVLT